MLTYIVAYTGKDMCPLVISYDDLCNYLELNFEELGNKFSKERGWEGTDEILSFAAALLERDRQGDAKAGILFISDSEEQCLELKKAGHAVCGLSDQYSRNATFKNIKYVIEDPDDMWPGDFDHIYRRLKKLPCEILETERLTVRETTVEDLVNLRRLYADREITEFMEDMRPEEEEIEHQKDYIDNVYGLYDMGIWSLLLKKDGSLIGRMGLEIKDKGTAELGFMLGLRYQGKGYATEAGEAILEYAQKIEGIENIMARVHKDNQASRKLLEKLGLVPTDRDKETVIYRLLKI